MRQIYYVFVFLVILAIALGLIFGLSSDSKGSSSGDNDSTLYSLLYSLNGQNWIGPSGPGTVRWVAAGQNLAISEPFAGEGHGVAYGLSADGTSLWVAAGSGSLGDPTLLFSLDGQSWQAPTTGASFDIGGLGVAFGLSADGTSLWVATGRGGNTLLFSLDGQSWQAPTTGASFGIGIGYDVAYGLSADGTSLWVAAGRGGGNALLFSLDGQSWQPTAGLSFGGTGHGVAYGLSADGTSLWVAAGEGDHSLLFSLDGQSWQASTGVSFSVEGFGVAYGLSSDNETRLWVAAGRGANPGDPTLLFSLDGQSWQTTTGTCFGYTGFGVAYGLSSDNEAGLWVATGTDAPGGGDNDLLFSLDGQSWQPTAGLSFVVTGLDVASNLFNRGLCEQNIAPFNRVY